jgi:SAM-dependent methyltransferase
VGSPDSLDEYMVAGFSTVDFPAGSRVIDVGCGSGRHLKELNARGCRAVGVEPDADRVRECRLQGFQVVQGRAEQLPFVDASFDGVLCNVALPYSDERKSISEWNRVLVPGGQVRASYHGFGYALRILRYGPGLRERLFAVKMIVNTWVYWLLGRRLPGRVGNTLCQSQRQMEKYYRQYGFAPVASAAGKAFWGFPVYLFHHLRKVN